MGNVVAHESIVMAKMQRQIVNIGEGEKFTVIKTNVETGKVSDSATYESDKPLKMEGLGTALGAEVKSQGNRRTMWLSLLGFVMADPKLEGYKGTADKATGKMPDGFKAAVRTCEENFLRHLTDKGLVKLHITKDDNAEKVFQTFATSVREDKNYSNAKSTVLRYFSIVGSSPVTKSGYLVPVPVMTESIASVLDANRVPDEKGYYISVGQLFADFNADKSPSIDDIRKLAPILKQWLSSAEGIITHEAELTTSALHGLTGSVKEVADAAMESAKATLASVKPVEEKASAS